MNTLTIDFKLNCIKEGKYVEGHTKELKEYISGLRLTSQNLKGTSINEIAEKMANDIESRLRKVQSN